MAVEVTTVQGAALGAAFEVLSTSVVKTSKKVAGFTSQLNRLESTLSSIKPTVDDIEKLNKILDRPSHETEALTARLVEAEQLVRKCSKVKKWNLWMRFYYSNKLSRLEASLFNSFQFNVAALQLCEAKRISVVVSDLQVKVNQIVMQMMVMLMMMMMMLMIIMMMMIMMMSPKTVVGIESAG